MVLCSPEEAFKASVECITGPISKIISTQGIDAVYKALDDEGKKIFEKVELHHPLLRFRRHMHSCKSVFNWAVAKSIEVSKYKYKEV